MANKDKNEKLTFEEALEKLEECSNKLGKDGETLEDAMKSYEDGINYYKVCKEILESAEQRIEEIEKNEGIDE